MQSIKYPRTHHLPWSDTIGPDGDHVLRDVSVFAGQQVVVTEKLDGENTTIYCDHQHARSLDSGHHVSRGWVKNFGARIGPHIPPDLRINGENMFALHSIAYDALPSYFIVFAVWRADSLLSWDETIAMCAQIERASGEILPLAPVLYRGIWDESKIRDLYNPEKPPASKFGLHSEGYVVRLTRALKRDEWQRGVAKYVRPRHVQSGPHWMLKPVEKTD